VVGITAEESTEKGSSASSERRQAQRFLKPAEKDAESKEERRV
jgi:hypothetical protein